MSYLVFARKWRPQIFDEIIGQEHITTTLKNAILNKRVAHAYLFSGPRGTGKTSTARIFAKALNCEKGPTLTPCNKCISCTEISTGISMDVIEIDGASNRSIDDIRNLRENVKFTPIHGNFKIYIIDEVHQISTDGFNALLKTLEEPPPHVKFIFATTQPNKVMPTILSRCQRFDFKRLTTSQIVSKLKTISRKENLVITDEALFAIGRHCDGSMRDAESVLDQLSSFGDKNIGLDNVNSVIGIVSDEIILKMMDNISKRDTKEILISLDELIAKGSDIFNLVSSLMEHARNLMVVKLSANIGDASEFTKEALERLKSQSGQFSVEELLFIFYLLLSTLNDMKRLACPRIALEMCLVKLTKMENISSITNLMEKLKNLEKNLNSEKMHENSSDISSALEEKKAISASDISEDSDKKTEAQEIQSAGQSAVSIEEVKKIWSQATTLIKAKKISAGIYFLDGAPYEIKGSALKIGFPKNLHKETLERPENKKLIEEVFKELLKVDLRVEFLFVPDIQKIEPEVLGESKEEADDFYDEEISEPENSGVEPIIRSALEIFDGEIIRGKDKNSTRH